MAVARKKAGWWRYIKEAFTYKWNLLLFGGAAAAALLSPSPDVVLPLVMAAEATYLAGLTTLPRFRRDRRQGPQRERPRPRHRQRARAARSSSSPQSSARSSPIGAAGSCGSGPAAWRWRASPTRCAARPATPAAPPPSCGPRPSTACCGASSGCCCRSRPWAASSRPPTAPPSRASWPSSNQAGAGPGQGRRADRRVDHRRGGHRRAAPRELPEGGGERRVHLGRARPARGQEIQALTEMAIGHQDPGELSTQVDAVAEGLNQTEETIRDLQSITGLGHDASEAPSILGNDLEVQ